MQIILQSELQPGTAMFRTLCASKLHPPGPGAWKRTIPEIYSLLNTDIRPHTADTLL